MNIETSETLEKDKHRRGVLVFIVLAVLTAGEFLIARVSPLWWAPLLFIALVKAFFIVRDYMHISRVFAGDEGEVRP